MSGLSQKVLDILEEYGATSLPVMALILDPLGQGDEAVEQLLEHLFRQGAIALVKCNDLTYIERN